MAQIPTIAAPTLTPPPEINPRISGQPGQAMAGAADQFASVADAGVVTANHIKQAQDQGIVLAAENDIESDIEKAHAQLANWTDYTHADQLKQDTAAALMTKYSDKYGDRPDLWRVIQPRLGKELNFYNGQVDVHAAKLTQDFNQSALGETLSKTVDKASLIPTLAGQELEWQEFDMKANAMAMNGSITFTQATDLKKEARAQTIQTQVERAANPLNPPEIMQAQIDRLKDYEGKDYVPAEKLAEYQKYLGEAYKVASRNSDEKAIARDGNAIIQGLTKDPTLKDPETGDIDYLKAAQKVDDNPDIPTDRKKYVREELEQRDGVQKRITAENNKKIYEKESPRIYSTDKPLTSAEIKGRARLSPNQPGFIPAEVESQLLRESNQIQRENRVENTQERMASRQEADYNSAQLFREMSATPGYLTSESELYQGDAAKLTKADRAQLWAEKNIGGVREYQDAVKMMNASSVYPQTDEGNRALADAKSQLRATVEANKLTGPQITEAAAAILKPKVEAERKQTVKTLLDNIWPIARSALPSFLPGGGVAPIQGLKAPPAETPPERPNGVPANAIWNGEAKQWQLPNK